MPVSFKLRHLIGGIASSLQDLMCGIVGCSQSVLAHVFWMTHIRKAQIKQKLLTEFGALRKEAPSLAPWTA